MRNPELIVNARKVYVKSLSGSNAIWRQLYATPSSIRWSTRSRQGNAGTQYETSLDVDFPGMGREQFALLHGLVNTYAAIQAETGTSDLYELAGEASPAQVSYSFRDFGTTITFNIVDRLPPYFISSLADGNGLMPQFLPLTTFEVDTVTSAAQPPATGTSNFNQPLPILI